MRRPVFIGLGSNMGDKKRNLRRAVAEIERNLARVIRRSSLYKTEPVGIKEQDEFINAAILVETELELEELLEGLLGVEEIMGRVRVKKHGPRNIDLDILLAGDEVIKQDGLQVPHPGIAERGFVLHPLVEIGPDAVHPVSGLTVRELLSRLDDPAGVERLDEKL